LFVEAEVRTTALTLHKVPDDDQLIHNEIMRLHSLGYLDKDISQSLDERGIPTPLNRKWRPQLVWHIRKYIRLREERKKDYSLEITAISCVFDE
jgi:phage terminase Nu1 subunit (DNA packaging protein)